MIASYHSSNPRAAWIKRDNLVRSPQPRRDEASPDGYDQHEAARLTKKIRIDQLHPRHHSNTSAATNVSTQALQIASSPTSPAFPASSPQASPTAGVSLQSEGPAVPLTAIAPPPLVPSTPTALQTLQPDPPPALEGPSRLPVDNPVGATVDRPLSPSASAWTFGTANIPPPSISTSPKARLLVPSSGPPLRNDIIQEGDWAVAEPTDAPSPSMTTTSISSASTRPIRNKAVDDFDEASTAALNTSPIPGASPTSVILDAGATPTSDPAVILDTGSDPTSPVARISTASSDGFSPITLMPGVTSAPSSSSPLSTSAISKTKTQYSTNTVEGTEAMPTSMPGADSQGNTADSGGSASASSSKDRSKAKGIIAGSIVGAAAGLALLFILVLFCYKRRKSRVPSTQSPVTAERRSPYGRFSIRNMSSSLPSLPSLHSLPPISFVKKTSKSPPDSSSDRNRGAFAFLHRQNLSTTSSISEKKPRAASYSGTRSPPSPSLSRRSSSFTVVEPFLPLQSSTEGTLDLAPAFRSHSPVVEPPRPAALRQATSDGVAPPRPTLAPLRNPFESSRKASHAPTTSKSSANQPLPPSPSASSVSNMLASPTSFHTRSSGALLPTEQLRVSTASSTSSSACTISLPPAYARHSRSISQPEPAPIGPVGPWRDSMWSVAVTPMGNTPRESAGWGGMGWPLTRGIGENTNNVHGAPVGYGYNASLANHRASKSSSSYTDSNESHDTQIWTGTAPPAPLFQASQAQSQNRYRIKQSTVDMDVPSVPRIPHGMYNDFATNTASDALGNSATSAVARPVHQRHPAMRAIPGAYIGDARHARRKSSVGVPIWEGDRRTSDDSTSDSGGSPAKSSNGNSNRSGQSSIATGSGNRGRDSENSVATVFRIHPGTRVKF